MKPIEVAKLNAAHRLSAGAAAYTAPARQSAAQSNGASESAGAQGIAVTRSATAGDTAPIDGERVELIRRAVEKGQYPIVPSEIADAMIAAKYLLRTKQ